MFTYYFADFDVWGRSRDFVGELGRRPVFVDVATVDTPSEFYTIRVGNIDVFEPGLVNAPLSVRDVFCGEFRESFPFMVPGVV